MITVLAAIALSPGQPRPSDDRLLFLTQDLKCVQLHATAGVWQIIWSSHLLPNGAQVLDISRSGNRVGVLFGIGTAKKIAVLSRVDGRTLAGPYAVPQATYQVRFLGTRAVEVLRTGGFAFAGDRDPKGSEETMAHTPDGRFLISAENSAMPMGGSGQSSLDVYHLSGGKLSRVVQPDDFMEGENVYSLAATNSTILVRRGTRFEAFRITPQGRLVATWSKPGGDRPCPIVTDGQRFAVATDAGVTVFTPRGAGWSASTTQNTDLDPAGARLALHGNYLAAVDANRTVWRFQIIGDHAKPLGKASINSTALFPIE